MSMAESQHPSDIGRDKNRDRHSRIVVMGVAGCGKTTIGEMIAARLGAEFRDGDALHPAANIAKMSAGIPLNDDDRWPWLETIGEALGSADGTLIIGCSALKRAYRDHIRKSAGGDVTFIHLVGTRDLITTRMAQRTGHFMPLSLLDSQFASLEPPASDETAIAIDIVKSQSEIVDEAVNALKGQDR